MVRQIHVDRPHDGTISPRREIHFETLRRRAESMALNVDKEVLVRELADLYRKHGTLVIGQPGVVQHFSHGAVISVKPMIPSHRHNSHLVPTGFEDTVQV